VNRRASLPGADELFRSTSSSSAPARPNRDEPRSRGGRRAAESATDASAPEASGRVRHDQKITVYLTGQELLDLEQARLRLRAEFDIAVDRGRIVREAVAELLQDLHDEGPDAAIVRRLS
jgi:erythromycin esterase-like protein